MRHVTIVAPVPEDIRLQDRRCGGPICCVAQPRLSHTFLMTTLGTDEWAGMDMSVRRGNDHDPSWFSGLTNLEDHYDMIIVGAGISGCVFAERGSKELGLRSLIIDKRDHIGGNCYDFINKHGFRVSQYGVHLFHTKFDRVWKYVNEFSEWMAYEHRVKGKVDVGEGYKIVPIPPSQETVNTLFHANVHTETEMEAWLNERRSVNENPANGEESALTRAGKERTYYRLSQIQRLITGPL